MGKWKTDYEEGRKYNKEWEKEFKWLTNRGNSYATAKYAVQK